MQRFFRPLSIAILIVAGGSAGAAAADDGVAVDPNLSTLLEAGERPLWIFFQDKGAGENSLEALARAESRLSERALARRAKVLPEGRLVSWQDLDVEPSYLSALVDAGFEIRAESRWLNAVSVVAGADDLDLLTAMPFVARIAPVMASGPRQPDVTPAAVVPRAAGEREDPLDYGGSQIEIELSNIHLVHQTGNHGEGVVIGMLDTGFNTNHEALVGVNVLGVWDFINDDGVVENEGGDAPGQENHGTYTLSTIGGNLPGTLLGPAFGASFYLGKTEDTTQEVPIEEDWWVEGIEWHEGTNGVDVVSSSLVYYDWYVQDDMDGNTAVTTIAADYAVSLGVVVVNSAGNYRQNEWGTIGAPADGDSVISCGAVESTGEIAGFSSPGPTADGRIKPDVCAMGVSNWIVLPGTWNEYGTASGTSFSAPLTAGMAALLLSARPDATPMMVRDAMRETASQANEPDNDYGWGIVDCFAALNALLATGVFEAPAAFDLAGNFPNPFNPKTSISFSLRNEGHAELEILDVRGRRVALLMNETLGAGHHQVSWDGSDDAGEPMASGVYFARLSRGAESARQKMVLLK